MHEVIRLHVEAPDKPSVGAVCNGCGVCCASEPCPVGVLVNLRTTGRCGALLWQEDRARYRCGLVEQPSLYLHAALRWTAPLLSRVARRYISSGSGCDCDVSVVRPSIAN